MVDIERKDIEKIAGQGVEEMEKLGLNDKALKKGTYIVTLDEGVAVIGLYGELREAFESEDFSITSCTVRALIKGINTYKPERGVRLATYASRCIENEILMHFRSQRKNAGDLSLSEALDTDGDGSGLSVMDVIAQEDDMAERLGSAEICGRLRDCIDTVLTPREARIVRLRYGLDGLPPMTQRDTAALCGISRSYVSRLEKRALEKLRTALGEDANPG